MFDLVQKTFLTGIGLALKTKDEVEEFAKDLIKKGKMSEYEGKAFVNDLVEKYKDTRDKLESTVEQTVQLVLKKADLVTKDEMKALKKEIIEIKKALNENKDIAP